MVAAPKREQALTLELAGLDATARGEAVVLGPADAEINGLPADAAEGEGVARGGGRNEPAVEIARHHVALDGAGGPRAHNLERGIFAVQHGRRFGRKYGPKVGATPSRMRPPRLSAPVAATVTMSSSVSSTERAASTMRAPMAVGVTFARVRSNRGVPSCCSSCAIWTERVGCETWQRLAAEPKWPGFGQGDRIFQLAVGRTEGHGGSR